LKPGTREALRALVACVCLSFAPSASALVLVQTSDPGFYNDKIGTILNGTNGGESGPFPVSNDSTLDFPTQPDLSAAASVLGNWLTDPLHLNSNWASLPAIPNGWPVGDEVAVIYQFNTLGATNVVARFGVDNGIFAWLNGAYIGGTRRGGGVALGEHVFTLGDLDEGTHFLQLLLEDHGITNGYAVEITADSFIPGPPPVPEPASLLLSAAGALALMASRYRASSSRPFRPSIRARAAPSH
jgi:hypothetical protein